LQGFAFEVIQPDFPLHLFEVQSIPSPNV